MIKKEDLVKYLYNKEIQGTEKGSGQLFVTLYTLSIYPSVHIQLIRTLFETHKVFTYFVWHPRDDHELVGHGVHVVHLELADPGVQGRVEQVHELNQLNIRGWLGKV